MSSPAQLPRLRFGLPAASLAALVLLAGAWMPAAAARARIGAPQQASAEEQAVLAKIKTAGDSVAPDLIKDLANFRTVTAMQSLLQLYDNMATVFMKREIVRALVKFDGVAGADLTALQKIRDVATLAKEIELRTAAVDALGECSKHGKDFLVPIVESAVEDQLRERAMRSHLRLHDKTDLDWYRKLYKPAKNDPPADKTKKNPPKPKKDKDGKEEEPPADTGADRKGAPLNPIRHMAFGALASDEPAEALVEACDDAYFKIRADALSELDRRGDKRATEIARDFMKGLGLSNTTTATSDVGANMVLGAQIWAKAEGPKCFDELVKIATQQPTLLELRRGIAAIIAGWNDERVNARLAAELTKGKEADKLFHIAATLHLKEKKVTDGLEQLLNDKEQDVVLNALKAIAERGQKESVEKVTKLVTKSKDRLVLRGALDALTVLRRGDPAWIDQLLAYTKHEDPEVRNLALQALGDTKEQKALEKLVGALNDENWSVRLAALDALEKLRMKEAVSAIIERMAKEEGRMLQEFSLALWRLTGQGFQENASGWSNWWKANGDKFEFVNEGDLAKVKSGEEEYRLRQTTRVEQKFFGIRIISHRVLFIIDVSGSMNELLNSEYETKAGQPRIDVAKRELERCVAGLDPAAFFNIMTFSSGFELMNKDGLLAANEKNRTEMRDKIRALGAGGGTNLYDSLKKAFEDPDIDTIFVLSDGEPSVGAETDPGVIREHVLHWNEHRQVQINTIAVGGQFQILEWLAADSKGTHVRFD